MKTCGTCRLSKPFAEFSKHRGEKDGYQRRCKECTKAYLREYYQANKSKWQEKYFADHEQTLALARERVWRRNQDPEVRAAKRERDRKAYQDNPDTYKAAAERRRERKRAATTGVVTRRDWEAIVRRQGGRCHYCGEPADLTEDHLIPLCRGGVHSVGNIVGACDRCNRQKGRKTRMEYRVWLRRVAA